jgi:hypothetical protein
MFIKALLYRMDKLHDIMYIKWLLGWHYILNLYIILVQFLKQNATWLKYILCDIGLFSPGHVLKLLSHTKRTFVNSQGFVDLYKCHYIKLIKTTTNYYNFNQCFYYTSIPNKCNKYTIKWHLFLLRTTLPII